MSFFKDFKDDLSQAVTELMPGEEEMAVQENAISLEEEEAVPAQKKSVTQETEKKEIVQEEIVKEEMVKEEAKLEEPAVPEPEPAEEKAAEAMEDIPISLPASEAEPEEEPEESDASEEITTISKGVKLEGNLNSTGSVELLGDVTGDVKCQGKLQVYGTIIGNPTAAEIYANSARIEGNINSEGSVKIGNGSIIIGNIKASSVVIGGAVKGDIDVNGPVIIDSTAVVVGNIKSRSVQLNIGAVLDGFVSQCYAGVDVDKLFASKNEAQKSSKKK